MDALQLLTPYLSGRCAFSVLLLDAPNLLPPGSLAVLFLLCITYYPQNVYEACF